jgi:hypothetical protein
MSSYKELIENLQFQVKTLLEANATQKKIIDNWIDKQINNPPSNLDKTGNQIDIDDDANNDKIIKFE